jgi:hyperosmotically inducible protein
MMNKLTFLSIAGALALAACNANTQTAQGTRDTSPSTSQVAADYIDDAGITAAIKGSILKDQALKGMDIHVETEKNIVQLSGFVDSSLQKSNAQRIAETTKGVRSVKNDIIVKS